MANLIEELLAPVEHIMSFEKQAAMDHEVVKACTKCGESKPVGAFSWSNKAKGYRRSNCKSCVKVYQDALRQENPDYWKDASRKHFEKDPERKRAQGRKYYADHAEQRRAGRREHYERNRETVLEKQRLYKEQNREKLAEYTRAYRQANPFVQRDSEAKRRATKKSVWVDDVRIETVLERDGWTCYLCLAECEPADVTLDHIIPLDLGGAHSYENTAIAHRSCNSRKHTKLVEPGAYADAA